MVPRGQLDTASPFRRKLLGGKPPGVGTFCPRPDGSGMTDWHWSTRCFLLAGQGPWWVLVKFPHALRHDNSRTIAMTIADATTSGTIVTEIRRAEAQVRVRFSSAIAPAICRTLQHDWHTDTKGQTDTKRQTDRRRRTGRKGRTNRKRQTDRGKWRDTRRQKSKRKQR